LPYFDSLLTSKNEANWQEKGNEMVQEMVSYPTPFPFLQSTLQPGKNEAND